MASQAATDQYLTFTLAQEQYAVPVDRVREVLEVPTLTRIPRMPDFMMGVINIRGSVLPVVDLRRKFGLPEAEHTVDTSIVVMDVISAGAEITVGCLADSVQEVIDLPHEQVEAPPKLGTSVEARFIAGMGKRDDRFIIILHMDRVFEGDDLNAVDEGARNAG
jgi:purine-binding chemotaxis protein CheW